MKPHALALAGLAALSLAAPGGCDRPKPRHVPDDPMAAAAPPAAVAIAQPKAGRSVGLARRDGMPGFSIDRIGPASDPLNRQPAVTPANQPIVVQGFGFDPVARTPAEAVDLVIDGKAYATDYGAGRADVAAYFKNQVLTPVGFVVTLPTGALALGPHKAAVRVIAADGNGYFEGPAIAFQVK